MAGLELPYISKLAIRMISLALSAAAGATAAGVVLLLPLMALHSLGAVRYRVEGDTFIVSALFAVGALVGQAYMLDTIVKVEGENR
jgi:hypothetical protein